MSKVVIDLNINNQKNKLNGIINDNRIVYSDNNVKTIIDTTTDLKIIRETNEYKIVLLFNENNNTSGSYYLKQYNKVIDISIKTKKLLINKNKIELNYILLDNDEEYIFELNYKIM